MSRNVPPKKDVCFTRRARNKMQQFATLAKDSFQPQLSKRLSVTAVLACLLVVSASPAPAADRKIDFNRNVQPIFATHCFACHGDKKQKSGLRLDRRPDAMLAKIIKN